MILHLDSNFKPVHGNEIGFEAFTFSGGEPHIRISEFDTSQRVTVTHRINSFNDLGLLSIAIDALRRMGCKEIELYLPYFPGARQDRVMTSGESLTAKVYTDIINSYDLSCVTIFDVHSDVVPALLHNCKSVSNHFFIKEIIKDLPSDLLLIAPDAGAAKKIQNLARYLKHPNILICGKSRDVLTGELSEFIVPLEDVNQKPCLIVDDICDGGGTFLGLGHELKKKNAGGLYLAVSHGIFSQGFEKLSELFTKVYTTNSIAERKHDCLKQINLSQIA